MGNGITKNEMVMAGMSKMMDPFFKDLGKMINKMETVEESVLKEKYMKANGLTTGCRAKGFFSFKMAHRILVNGLTINNMATDTRNGQTEHNTKEISKRVSSKVMEF